MLLNHVILALLWIIYCVLHSVLAGNAVKQKLQHQLGKKYRYYRVFYTVFALIFLIALIYFQINLSTYQLFNLSITTLLIGIFVSFAGLVIMFICIWKYFIRLSGLRSLTVEEGSNMLMITGIHRYVRHPLYLGTFLFIWGLFLVIPLLSLLVTNTIITIYTLIGIGLEEKKLISEFGDSYLRYRSKVPRLLPLLKPKREE